MLLRRILAILAIGKRRPIQKIISYQVNFDKVCLIHKVASFKALVRTFDHF